MATGLGYLQASDLYVKQGIVMSKLTFVFAFFMVCISAHGASFDCNLAKSSIEKLICANAELSAADEELSKFYSDMKSQAQRPDLLTQSQLEWLKRRNECKDNACLINEYKIRKEFISNWLEYEKKTLTKSSGEVECADRPECWPEGSAMHTGLTLVAHQKKISAQLEAKHAELIALLSSTPNFDGKSYPDSRVISALIAQQVTWVKYRDDECELIGSLTGAGGSWPSTYANKCQVNLTEERLRRVTSAIKCIQKIPLEKRWMEEANCLQQLAPLANKL